MVDNVILFIDFSVLLAHFKTIPKQDTVKIMKNKQMVYHKLKKTKTKLCSHVKNVWKG